MTPAIEQLFSSFASNLVNRASRAEMPRAAS